MADILFSHSYFYRFDTKQWEDKRPYPPYGTIYAAALMRSHHFSVALYDSNLKENISDLIPVLDKEKPKYFVIYDDGFNYLTKMCLTRMRAAAFDMIEAAKKRNAKIIVCSSDSTDHYLKYIDKGADFIITGEGELTLLELLKTIALPDPDFSSVSGLIYSDKNGTVISNPKRPVLKNLDELPDPAWDLVDIDAYKKIWIQNHGFFSLNIATTRGCPYKCNWCAKPIYGNRYNSRSPLRVANEMEFLAKEYGADYFWICDDIFGLKPGWVQKFRSVLEEKKMSVRYKIQSRVDLLLKEDTIDALAASGLDTVWVGAESGSQKILDAMDKGTDVKQIYQATHLLKSKGVKVAFFLQFGYLDENMEDIRKTIDMLLDLMPNDIGISVSYPLPGTKFFEIVKSQMVDKQNWEDSDDLDIMFQASFSSGFYKRLHRYVHKVFRKKQGWQAIKALCLSPQSVNKKSLRSALSTFYYLPAVEVDKFRLNRLK